MSFVDYVNGNQAEKKRVPILLETEPIQKLIEMIINNGMYIDHIIVLYQCSLHQNDRDLRRSDRKTIFSTRATSPKYQIFK